MGIKGDKMTQDSVNSAESFLNKINDSGEITSKKMFGGHGIFSEGKMFGMIDSKGIIYLKVDETLKEKFIKAGGTPHSKMPYVSIPEKILEDKTQLLNWVSGSQKLIK